MIVYFETTALLARYVRDPMTESILKLWDEATIPAAGRLAFAECVAVFAAKRREGALDPEAFARQEEVFRADFARIFVVPSDDRHDRVIDALHARRSLGAAGAAHVAAALRLKEMSGANVAFATMNPALAAVAAAEGLATRP